MKYKMRTAVMPIAAGFVILCYAGGSGAQPFLATGADAEVTEDGLHRVDRSIMGTAWVRPDLDLSGYTRIFFSPTTVEFREIGDGVQGARVRDNASQFEVSEVRRVQFRERWAQILYENLSEVDSYEMFDSVGRDVLMVRGRLVDVASGVPPDIAASVETTIMYPWEATIVLELRDSMSDEILARSADRRRMVGPINANAVQARTGTLLRRWTDLLCARLEELSALGEP